jgi:hypothetical protein
MFLIVINVVVCRIYGLMARFLATDPRVPVSIPGATKFSLLMGLEQDPLSLVKITEELLERKSRDSGKETDGRENPLH